MSIWGKHVLIESAQEGAARLGNDTLYYYLPRFLTTHPKKGGSFKVEVSVEVGRFGLESAELVAVSALQS